MLFLTKRIEFSAAHRLYNPTFTYEQNEALFDKCNNPNGHGHNYVLEVTVKGTPKDETGYVIDLKKLKKILNERIYDKCDHKHLNYDVDFIRGAIPTVENLAVLFWQQIEPAIVDGELHQIRLYETDSSWADYYGLPYQVKFYDELK